MVPRMRRPIAQLLLGVRGSQLKTGGSYGAKTQNGFSGISPQGIEIWEIGVDRETGLGRAHVTGRKQSPGGHFGVEMGCSRARGCRRSIRPGSKVGRTSLGEVT